MSTKKQKPALHHKIRHQVHMAVVPHKKNKYQPHLVRLPGLLLVFIVALALNVTHLTLQNNSVLGESSDSSMTQLLAATNSEREKMGSEPLKLDDKLNLAAAMKAKDILDGQYWAHTSPNGASPWTWFEKADYDYKYAGENLARGFRTANGVVAAWMDSTEHRHNLLNPEYKNAGFAVLSGELKGEKTNVVVALYGTPAPKGQALVSASVLASGTTSLGPIARLGVAVQSLSPVALGSIMLLAFVVLVALLAHAYRKKLPKPLQRSWRLHHGLYKAAGVASVAVMVVALYGGGQI